MIEFRSVLIVIMIFLIITFPYWKLTHNFVERVYGKKTFYQWGSRTYYWHTALLVSGKLTVVVILFLKWSNAGLFISPYNKKVSHVASKL
ncbi:hypothetical protein [Gelidibacter pelagius]|uniref:Uncharacterized protein n=1 Tax=Gelidibacter pelagius TaxID=2819985 RepID=A0ABS3SW34_9FLAO|nr:hypothetical protein [Gelidibacter pelagius]MBO3099962.1 hypothetical protein [Gelidibacter pelagius]